MAANVIKVFAACILLSRVCGKRIRPFLIEDFKITDNHTKEYSNPHFTKGMPDVGFCEPKNMSLYTIIPAKTMKDFYNMVMRRSIPGEVNRLGEGLKNVMEILNSDWKRTASVRGNDYEMEAAKKVNISTNAIAFFNILQNHSNTMDFDALPLYKRNDIKDGFEQMIRYYIWLPGNLYVGPIADDRSDDPNDGFETKACLLADSQHFKSLKRVNKLISQFVKENAGCSNVLLVDEVVEELEDIAENRPSIYSYARNKWVRSARPPYNYSFTNNTFGLCSHGYAK